MDIDFKTLPGGGDSPSPSGGKGKVGKLFKNKTFLIVGGVVGVIALTVLFVKKGQNPVSDPNATDPMATVNLPQIIPPIMTSMGASADSEKDTMITQLQDQITQAQAKAEQIDYAQPFQNWGATPTTEPLKTDVYTVINPFTGDRATLQNAPMGWGSVDTSKVSSALQNQLATKDVILQTDKNALANEIQRTQDVIFNRQQVGQNTKDQEAWLGTLNNFQAGWSSGADPKTFDQKAYDNKISILKANPTLKAGEVDRINSVISYRESNKLDTTAQKAELSKIKAL